MYSTNVIHLTEVFMSCPLQNVCAHHSFSISTTVFLLVICQASKPIHPPFSPTMLAFPQPSLLPQPKPWPIWPT